jgi:hypothetical protein
VTARQPDSSRFRWWEIAGAAHADTYVLGAGFRDSGDLPPPPTLAGNSHPDERRLSGGAWHRITSRPGAIVS